jgi:hypothetical protein
MRTLAALSILCLTSLPALAANDSAYTEFDLDKCKLIESVEDEGGYASFSCPGYGGNEVFFAEGDLRGMLAIGTDPENHCAARQSFGPFNSIDGKIEWRLKGGKPFATIQRWRVSDPEDSEKSYPWLVITRLEGEDSCRAALVEGAMPNANQIARDLADTFVPAFSCETGTAKVVARRAMEAGDLMWGTPCPKE